MEMVDFIVFATTAALITACGFGGVMLGKRYFMKMSVLVAGYPRKNRVAIKDEALKPFLWRMRFWMVWECLAIGYAFGLSIVEGQLGNWRLVILAVAVSAVAAVVFDILRRSRWRDFLKEAEAKGGLERDADAIKEATAAAMGEFNKAYTWVFIVGIITSVVSAVLGFVGGNYITGALFTLCTGCFIYTLISARLKAKRGK